ncbi:MAG: hypothetical protein ACP5GJ_01990 [Nanopusillaceae archaeon]
MSDIKLEDLRNEKIEDNKHKLLEIKLIFDNPNIRFEQIYFWLLDFIRDSLKMNISKLSDEFTSSVGSLFFGEMSQRATAVLNTARSLGELFNTLTRSIISILSEYKQIQTRIFLYEKILSNDKDEAYSAYLTLKDIWINNVDTNRGAASLANISRGRLGFATAIDLFYISDLKNELEKLKNKGIIGESLFNKIFNEQYNIPRDLNEIKNKGIINEQIYNVVNIRLQEFYNWLEINKKYLYDRNNLLKAYLRHQLSSLLYYVEFAKPYFKFARKLLQNPEQPIDVVNALETAIINLTLFSTGKETNVKEYNEKEEKEGEKTYLPLYEIDITARALPTLTGRVEGTRMYSFIGRADIYLRAYIVEKSEYENILVNQEAEDLLYITGLTDEYLKDMSDIILEMFLYDIIKNDEKLLKLVANRSNAKPDEIKNNPYKIKWTKELIEELEKNERIKKAMGSIRWIKKYLESEKKEEKNEEKKEEKEGESGIQLIFPSLSNIFMKIFEFITTFGKDLNEIGKNIKKKNIENEKKYIMDDLKDKTIDTAWKIYMTFKKTFGMLNY